MLFLKDEMNMQNSDVTCELGGWCWWMGLVGRGAVYACKSRNKAHTVSADVSSCGCVCACVYARIGVCLFIAGFRWLWIYHHVNACPSYKSRPVITNHELTFAARSHFVVVPDNLTFVGFCVSTKRQWNQCQWPECSAFSSTSRLKVLTLRVCVGHIVEK